MRLQIITFKLSGAFRAIMQWAMLQSFLIPLIPNVLADGDEAHVGISWEISSPQVIHPRLINSLWIFCMIYFYIRDLGTLTFVVLLSLSKFRITSFLWCESNMRLRMFAKSLAMYFSYERSWRVHRAFSQSLLYLFVQWLRRLRRSCANLAFWVRGSLFQRVIRTPIIPNTLG